MRAQTPQKSEMLIKANYHKHTFSTPVPNRSPTPSKSKVSIQKVSSSSLGFKKIDLRKGIFSNKQVFLKNPIAKPNPISKKSEVKPQIFKVNKYQVLSKEFKIDKQLFIPKRVEIKDSEGFYVPEKPPFIHEDTKFPKD